MDQSELKAHKKALLKPQETRGEGNKQEFLVAWKPTWETTAQIPLQAVIAYAGDITQVVERYEDNDLGVVWRCQWSKLPLPVWTSDYATKQWSGMHTPTPTLYTQTHANAYLHTHAHCTQVSGPSRCPTHRRGSQRGSTGSNGERR